MLTEGRFIVVDIGKTLSKVTLWSRDGRMLDRKVRRNASVTAEGLRRLDSEGIAAWLIEALASHRDQPVEAIVPVGHGAGVVALKGDRVALPSLDYEQALPSELLRAYRTERDGFAVTGSPALPDGLNIGSQLYCLDRLYPDAMREAVLLPWAQYWAWFLSGQAASEITSLGCHSDLWAPGQARFSPLAERMGWAARFAPLRAAGDVIGTLRPELAAATGLSTSTRVLVGLHDSNAALLAARGFAAIAEHEATVLSTGTWFIAMRLPAEGADLPVLPEDRDCLVNIDVRGHMVPSARFMGGREIEAVIGIDTRRVDIKPDQPKLLAAVSDVVDAQAMLLPTLAPGCGPFPKQQARWLARPDSEYGLRASICLYAALVADAALDLVGSRARLLVEGRFAEAAVFVRALATLRPDSHVYTANAHNDVSFGALRLLDPALAPQGELQRVEPIGVSLDGYRDRWRTEVGKPR